MTYDALGDLTSITDADGNTTQYSYSSAGNLLSITYPDGTQQSFTYDPLGNLSETIEQNGDPVNYQYNAQGLVTQETFADGTYRDLRLRRPRQHADGANLRCRRHLTGTTTLTYNAANELTVDHLSRAACSLDFTYNAAGPAHPERGSERLHDQLQLRRAWAGCPS